MANPYVLNVPGPTDPQIPPPPGMAPGGPAFANVGLPAPNMAAMPSVPAPSPLPPHLQYVQEHLGNASQGNQAIEAAMQNAQAGGPPPMQTSALDDYARERSQLAPMLMGAPPQIPGPPTPNPIGWQQAIPAIVAGLINPYHSGEYAAMPFQAAVHGANVRHANQMQQYEAQVQQRQEQIANAVKELGLTQDQAQMEAGRNSAMYSRWMDNQKLIMDQAHLANEITSTQMNALDKLPSPEAKAEYAKQNNIGSLAFQEALSHFGPADIKNLATAGMDTAHADYFKNRSSEIQQMTPAQIAALQAKTGLDVAQTGVAKANAQAIPVRSANDTTRTQNDTQRTSIAGQNANTTAAHDRAMETIGQENATNAQTRTKYEFPGGVKVTNLAPLQHEARVAQADVNKYVNDQRYWGTVRDSATDDNTRAIASDHLHTATSGLIQARSRLQQAQAALSDGSTPFNPGRAAVAAAQKAGVATISGGTLGGTGKVKMPTAKAGVNLQTEKANAAAMIRLHPESRDAIAAMFEKRTGVPYGG